MPKFTEEQLQAINEEGSNIIVSAGAGSGKTAVLSERVLRKLKSGVNIDKLLILTFTNEAANEMKERIRQKIEKDDSLSRQLDLIDSAYITTFDSFSLSMVKKYHYLLNVSKDISIIDSSIINIKEQELLDEIFDELYMEEDQKFLKLITDFCVKDDKTIKNYIYNINNDLDKLINKQEFLTNYVDNFYNDEYLDSIVNEYLNLIHNTIDKLNSNLKILEGLIETDSDNNKYQEICGVLEDLIGTKDYLKIKKLSNKDFKLMGKFSLMFRKQAKLIKDYYKELQDLVKYESLDDIKNDILSTKNYVEIIIKIINILDERLISYKQINDTYEFNDIALMAIRLLEDNPGVLEEIKNTYNEILLDEYQDTSDIQEKFMSLIENNNLYMVGDVKQSIYRFRNANPLIFKNKYDNYSKGINGKKIDLLKNFRSRSEVLTNINKIFNIIMDNYIGGADYKDSHQMNYGLTLYDLEDVGHNNNLDIYNYNYDDKKYSKEEIEAFIIANDIKNKIEDGYLVFDKDMSKIRKATYNDFCIIMDRGSAFTIYKKIFEYLNIPLTIYMDQKLNEEKDILVIKSIINLCLKIKDGIFDQEFKYYYTSVARSFLSDMNDQEIFEVFTNDKYKETEIYRICEEIAYNIDSVSNIELLDMIIAKFNVYERCITISKVEDSFVRIDNLKNIADNLNKLGYSPYMFRDYLNKMDSSDNDIKYSINNKQGDNVKIMNIHKSKGLEFPVCYFSGFHKKFNFRDIESRFMFDNKYGIITPINNEGISKTILNKLVSVKYYSEEISEKIRLLYVALTRAREKMIIVTSLKELEDIEVDNSVRENYRSFLDILVSLNSVLKTNIKEVDIKNLNISKDYNISKDISIKDIIRKSDDKVTINNIVIDSKMISTSKVSKNINKLITHDEVDKLNLGTYIHYLFETIDFNNVDKYKDNKYYVYISNFIEKIGNIKNAKFYKEYEFVYEKENKEFNGIIDLVIVYPDHIKVIDYKLKNIDDDAYKKQLEIYKDFVSTKTNKPIYTYLYSILNNELKKLED